MPQVTSTCAGAGGIVLLATRTAPAAGPPWLGYPGRGPALLGEAELEFKFATFLQGHRPSSAADRYPLHSRTHSPRPRKEIPSSDKTRVCPFFVFFFFLS